MSNELVTECLKHKDTRYRHHGLFGERKRSVFATLFQKQQGRCAICDRSQDELTRKFQIDHCHTTGTIRGLLCAECNAKLGMAEHYTVISSNGLHFKSDNAWVWVSVGPWLKRYKERILSYLQREREVLE